VDKLAVADPGTYPRDHAETFKGNVDDNFKVGIKLTRKSAKPARFENVNREGKVRVSLPAKCNGHYNFSLEAQISSHLSKYW
jgi:hypothetical protein